MTLAADAPACPPSFIPPAARATRSRRGDSHVALWRRYQAGTERGIAMMREGEDTGDDALYRRGDRMEKAAFALLYEMVDTPAATVEGAIALLSAARMMLANGCSWVDELDRRAVVAALEGLIALPAAPGRPA